VDETELLRLLKRLRDKLPEVYRHIIGIVRATMAMVK